MTMATPPPDAQPTPDERNAPSTAPALTEHRAKSSNGIVWLIILFALLLVTLVTFFSGLVLLAFLAAFGSFVIIKSFYMLKPNQAAVRTLFGDYRGTDRKPGLRIGNPFYASFKVSLRVRNFTTTSSKVNDANGNPINIAAVVVWRVVDTARARFGVDDFTDYVRIQSEAAVRQMARSYPYESFDDPTATSLIGEAGDVNRNFQHELQERARAAGVEIIEARITDLSYATEVADAMLRRQQAAAIIAGGARSSRAPSAWCRLRSPASKTARTGTRPSPSATSARPPSPRT